MKLLLALTAVLVLLAIAVLIKRKLAKARRSNNISVKLGEGAAETSKSESIQRAASIQPSKISTVERAAGMNKVSHPVDIERQSPKSTSFSPNTSSEEKIPEDSTLRRHYLSTRQAKQEAIIHPYPTDSSLRRHHESMLAMGLKETAATAGSIQNPVKPANKLHVPEDSALKRHFLTQVQAEIEAQLFPRPTDSALRRHYDSQVKAKLEEYLEKAAM